MPKRAKVVLGDTVQDPVTKYKGIAYQRSVYIQGCDRIGIQAPTTQDQATGKLHVPELFFVDEPQLKVLKRCKPVKKVTTGGPSGFGGRKHDGRN